MKTRYIIFSALAAVTLLAGCGPKQEDGVYVKPRVIVTCDPELDDNNSMIRYVLHANDFQTEALVYNASRFHWRGDGKGTTQFIPGSEYDNMGLGPQTSWRYKWDESFIDDIVDAYGQCYENLKVHDPSYPTYEELKSKIRVGNVDFEGEIDHDTPGSELIKEIILDDKPGPVFCQAWAEAHPSHAPSSPSRKRTREQKAGTIFTRRSVASSCSASPATRTAAT